MKKVLANLILINILAILLLPSLVLGAVPLSGSAPSPPPAPQALAAVGGIELENPIQVDSIQELVNGVIDWVIIFGMALAPLMIIIAAYYFITAMGDPAKIKKARDIIFWTIVGIVIILLSKGIILIIQNILTVQ